MKMTNKELLFERFIFQTMLFTRFQAIAQRQLQLKLLSHKGNYYLNELRTALLPSSAEGFIPFAPAYKENHSNRPTIFVKNKAICLLPSTKALSLTWPLR